MNDFEIILKLADIDLLNNLNFYTDDKYYITFVNSFNEKLKEFFIINPILNLINEIQIPLYSNAVFDCLYKYSKNYPNNSINFLFTYNIYIKLEKYMLK